MPLTIPAQADIAQQYLDELVNQLPDADITQDSDHAVRANAISSVIWGVYQYAGWELRQAFPDTADTDFLVMHARTRNLTRKQATAAAGGIILSGAAKTDVASGLQFRVKGNGTLYQTTESGQVDDAGSLTVAARAMTAGTAGNLSAGATGTLVSAPAGIDSTVTVVSMTGATDTETDDELLTRLLDVMRQPPAGGNAHDYKVWAESVEGVSRAYVFPLRRGLGTVDVVITAANGLPSAATISAVQAYIDSVRPVTARDCRVMAPTEKVVDIAAAVGISDATSLDAVTRAITSSQSAWFSALIPGQEAIKTQIGALIADTEGVLDYDLTAPVNNTLPVVDETTVEWVRLGKVTITQLMASS
ncbi:phage tail protein [Pantoea rodasii]|uniref:Phage tail protein n=1 Tax=Pantoea rodasii TaxID=1076549 RepID=A0A2M9WHQ0_9GAMM|nr:baseplate J/gp47 family protein [Pantoea rodasii]ORM62213.1 phage tail protein [Pantoea rodasii]PJZ07019.1 phage tail protein [Pantoea rodasii]